MVESLYEAAGASAGVVGSRSRSRLLPIWPGSGSGSRRSRILPSLVPNPSAALIKALLINGAEELRRQYKRPEAGPSPNNSSSFGRVNLENSIIVRGLTPNADFRDEDKPLSRNETFSFAVPIPGRQKGHEIMFKITLVWSDSLSW